MKRVQLFSILLLGILLVFNSCGRDSVKSGKGAVNLMCDCFIDAGIENEYDIMDMDHDQKLTKKVIKCLLPILKDVRSELDVMSDDERVDYIGDAIKAAVDCECGDKLLEFGAKLYDTRDAEDGFDDLIESLEWLGGYGYGSGFGSSLFGGYDDYYDYYDEYVTEQPDYDYEYPEIAEVEEDCYGDYYILESELIDLFIDNIAKGYIELGKTTRSEMEDLTGDSDEFYADYSGIHVSGYFEYDEKNIVQYISLDYYYECDDLLGYLDIDKKSITSAIESSLDKLGKYDDYDSYSYDPGVEWKMKDMTIRQANYSDGFAIYIESDDYNGL
ncbi:MAG: hypothetical protein H6599_09355 [Flavobacteriales bacterium]|nr:hypothetical protein [Flavobacteriales bacterium]